MWLKKYLKQAKTKLNRTKCQGTIGSDRGANHTVDDPVYAPRLREISLRTQTTVTSKKQTSPPKRRLREKLGYKSLRSIFKIRRVNNANESHSDKSCVSAPTISSIPRTISNQFSPVGQNISDLKESHVGEPQTERTVVPRVSTGVATKTVTTSLVRARVMNSRHILHRAAHSGCAISIVRNEGQVLNPIATYTTIAIRLHLCALARQHLDQHHVRNFLELVLPEISAWRVDVLCSPTKRLVDAIFDCMVRVASNKGFKEVFATCKPLLLAESAVLVGREISSIDQGKVFEGLLEDVSDLEENQAAELFFEDGPENTSLGEDQAICTDASTSTDSEDTETSDSTRNEASQSGLIQIEPPLSPVDTPPTSKESYGETCDGENIAILAKTYASKEAVIQDYDFVLHKQNQDHEFELEDLQESHEAKMKRAKAAHKEEIEMVRKGCQEEVRKALRRVDEQAGEMREQFFEKTRELRKTEHELSDLKTREESLENALGELQREHQASITQLGRDERGVFEDRIENLRQKVKVTKSAANTNRVELQGEINRLRVLYDTARADHFTLARCESENGDWSNVVMKADQQQEAAQALIISQGMHRKEEERANKLAGEVQSLERANDKNQQTIEKLEAIIRGFDTTLALRRDLQGTRDRNLASLASAYAAGKAEQPSLESQKAAECKESLLNALQEAVTATATAQALLETEKRERREEVSDLRRELTALRQTLLYEEVAHQDAESEKIETAKVLANMTEHRDNLQHQCDELHQQLETRAFGSDQDALWHQAKGDIQAARDEAREIRKIALESERLLCDRETAHQMYRDDQYHFWQQMGKEYPQTKHIADKDGYHCIILAMLKRFEAELEQKKLLVDVTDFLAAYDEADVSQFLEFGAMGNFIDIYCDEDKVQGSLQNSKFSKVEIEAARIAIEDVVKQNRAKEMQEARVADANWNKALNDEETEVDTSSFKRGQESGSRTSLHPPDEAHEQQPEHQGQSLDDGDELSDTSSWIDTTGTASDAVNEEQGEGVQHDLVATPVHSSVSDHNAVPSPETRIRQRSQRARLLGGNRAQIPPYHVGDLIGNYTPTTFTQREARRQLSDQHRDYEQTQSTTPPSTPPRHNAFTSELSARLSQFDSRTAELHAAEVDYTNPYVPPGNAKDYVWTGPVIGPPIVFQSENDRQKKAQKAEDKELLRQHGAF